MDWSNADMTWGFIVGAIFTTVVFIGLRALKQFLIWLERVIRR